MAAEIKSINIPTKGLVEGTTPAVKSINIPVDDKIEGTLLSVKSITIGMVAYCIEVQDEGSNPIQAATVTISGIDYITDVNGKVIIFVFSGVVCISATGFATYNNPYTFDSIPDNECLVIQLTQSVGMATKIFASPIIKQAIQNVREFCFCNLQCEYTEFAFVGLTEYTNDKSSFLFQKSIPSDSIDIEIWKDGVNVSAITDQSFGDYYPTFTAQPLKVGFVADWKLISDSFGFGLYQVKAQQTIIGQPSTFESRQFQVLPFTEEQADGTVKIVTTQTGFIDSKGPDYRGLLPNGWIQYYRIQGQFGQKTPQLEIDNYLNSQYEKQQIIDKVTNQYTLETGLLPASIFNALNNNNLLANCIRITDYNLLNQEDFRNIPVYPSSIEDILFTELRYQYKVVFNERLENKRKRNV